MGRKTVRFSCRRCLHCCTDVVCLPTPWDAIQLAKATRANPYEFLEFVGPEGVETIPKSDPTWLTCNGDRYLMALRRDDRKGCFFLDKRTRVCAAYESRPLLCRLFPFKIHETRTGEFKAFSLHKDIDCPKHRDSVYGTRPFYEMYLEDLEHQEAYAEMVAVFNRRRGNHKEPEDFIKQFIDAI